MDRIIIDTHILVSLLVEDSGYFEKAKKLVENNVVYIPINILLEFIFLTIRKLKDTVAQLAKIILKKEQLQTENVEEAHENQEDFKKIASTTS